MPFRDCHVSRHAKYKGIRLFKITNEAGYILHQLAEQNVKYFIHIPRTETQR